MYETQSIKALGPILSGGVALFVLVAMFARVEAAPPSVDAEGPPKVESLGGHGGALTRPRGERGGAVGGRIHEWFKNFRERQPEKYRELMKLREDDPRQFRQRLRQHMRELVQEGRAKRQGVDEEKIRDLVHEFRQAETEAERRELRDKLRARLAELFDGRIADQQKQLAEMEARIDEVRQVIQRRLEHRDTIIEDRLDDVLRPPELRWRMDQPR